MPIRPCCFCFIFSGSACRSGAVKLLRFGPSLHLRGHSQRVLSGAFGELFIRMRMASWYPNTPSCIPPSSNSWFFLECASTSHSTTNTIVVTIPRSEDKRYAPCAFARRNYNKNADLGRLTAIRRTASSVVCTRRSRMTVSRHARKSKWPVCSSDFLH